MNCSNCEGCNDTGLNIISNKESLPLITSIFLNVTQKCNLKCKYCFVDQYPREMDYKTAKDEIDFIIKNAEIQGDEPSVNFFGGEPTLKWNEIVVPIVNFIRKEYAKPFTIGITTNGTLLDEDKMRFIKENNMGLLVSIDGDKETQNINRPFHSGAGSFDCVTKIIPSLLEYQPNSTFRMTIDHDNGKDLFNNCKFAVETGYKTIFFVVNVFTEWSEEERIQLKENIHLLADYYMELIREDKKINISQFSAAIRNIKRINEFYNNKRFRNATDKPAYGKCGLGANRFASVGFDGDIYSCQEMVGNRDSGDKFIIGNIYTGVDNDKRWSIINSFDVNSVRCSDEEKCKSCRLYNICDGYCTINNYFSSNDLNVVPEILCYMYSLCIDEMIRVMNTMAEEKNELFKSIFINS